VQHQASASNQTVLAKSGLMANLEPDDTGLGWLALQLLF